jgi:SAM-dependent methyltransferase
MPSEQAAGTVGGMADHHQHGHQHGHGHGPHRHSHGDEADSAALAEMLELDAEVFGPYLADVVDWVHELAPAPTRRVLDVGAGTGTGSLALARRFADADVLALDLSADLLARLHDKARDLGVADRVRTVQADLDAAWPAVDPVDVAWAANSLHHLADPDRALAAVLAALRPGGLLAVAELDSFPRFLPDEVGDGLEARCHAMVAEEMAEELPHLGSDWGARLRAAGFTVEAERTFTIELTPPLPAATGRFARTWLGRLRSGLDGRLSAEDAAALDALVDGHGPGSVLRRDDLAVRTARTVWAARRP